MTPEELVEAVAALDFEAEPKPIEGGVIACTCCPIHQHDEEELFKAVFAALMATPLARPHSASLAAERVVRALNRISKG